MPQSQDQFKPSEDFRKDLRYWEIVAPHLKYQSMTVVDQMGPEESIDMYASGGHWCSEPYIKEILSSCIAASSE